MSGGPPGAVPGPTPAPSVGKYTRIKLLGKGGFGSAWLVTPKAGEGKGRLLVLKEVRVGADRKAAEGAAKEASFLKSMRHPNIVGYVESWLEGGALYIAMEVRMGGGAGVEGGPQGGAGRCADGGKSDGAVHTPAPPQCSLLPASPLSPSPASAAVR